MICVTLEFYFWHQHTLRRVDYVVRFLYYINSISWRGEPASQCAEEI